MGILGRIFGQRKLAPLADVHAKDQDLVRREDIAWWRGLSDEDVAALQAQDDIFRFAHWNKLVKEDGLSSLDAGKQVHLHWPTYYLTIAQRLDEKFGLPDDDAAIPVVLKERINRAVTAGIITKDEIKSSSSFNALVRRLIRDGRI